jgi:hypothetical protein
MGILKTSFEPTMGGSCLENSGVERKQCPGTFSPMAVRIGEQLPGVLRGNQCEWNDSMWGCRSLKENALFPAPQKQPRPSTGEGWPRSSSLGLPPTNGPASNTPDKTAHAIGRSLKQARIECGKTCVARPMCPSSDSGLINPSCASKGQEPCRLQSTWALAG